MDTQRDFPVICKETNQMVGFFHSLPVEVHSCDRFAVKLMRKGKILFFQEVSIADQLALDYSEYETVLPVLTVPPLDFKVIVVSNERDISILNSCPVFIPMGLAMNISPILSNHAASVVLQ